MLSLLRTLPAVSVILEIDNGEVSSHCEKDPKDRETS
jgi:hypothetical protein